MNIIKGRRSLSAPKRARLEDMKVAVVHYHLQPGGVTRVIENTLNSFNQKYNSTKFVVLSGRQYPGNQIQNVKIVDGLDYSLPKQAILPKTLREQMESAATEALGGKPDIWHIHNHSLGKNPSLTKVVDLLAQDSIPLLLHPHDFAEDGRPSNFQAIRRNIFYRIPFISTGTLCSAEP